MSDVDDDVVDEETIYQEKMAQVKHDMLVALIALGVGITFLLTMWIPSTNALLVLVWMAVAFIAPAWPVISTVSKYGVVQSLFYWKHYEVITTYGDGRKESDGGTESTILSLIFKCIMFGLLVVLGYIVGATKLIVLPLKYLYYYKKASHKPAFMQTIWPIMIGFPIVIVAVVLISGLLGSIIITSSITDVIPDAIPNVIPE